jgi:hypothetical protein
VGNRLCCDAGCTVLLRVLLVLLAVLLPGWLRAAQHSHAPSGTRVLLV